MRITSWIWAQAVGRRAAASWRLEPRNRSDRTRPASPGGISNKKDVPCRAPQRCRHGTFFGICSEHLPQQLGELADDGILHTKYNEFDSYIDPILHWLRDKGVHFVNNVTITDLKMDDACTVVTQIVGQKDGAEFALDVRPNDMVISTLASMTQNSTQGDNTHPVTTNRSEARGMFSVWQKLAARDVKFDHPEKFCSDIEKSKWMSAMVIVKGYKEVLRQVP